MALKENWNEGFTQEQVRTILTRAKLGKQYMDMSWDELPEVVQGKIREVVNRGGLTLMGDESPTDFAALTPAERRAKLTAAGHPASFAARYATMNFEDLPAEARAVFASPRELKRDWDREGPEFREGILHDNGLSTSHARKQWADLPDEVKTALLKEYTEGDDIRFRAGGRAVFNAYNSADAVIAAIEEWVSSEKWWPMVKRALQHANARSTGAAEAVAKGVSLEAAEGVSWALKMAEGRDSAPDAFRAGAGNVFTGDDRLKPGGKFSAKFAKSGGLELARIEAARRKWESMSFDERIEYLENDAPGASGRGSGANETIARQTGAKLHLSFVLDLAGYDSSFPKQLELMDLLEGYSAKFSSDRTIEDRWDNMDGEKAKKLLIINGYSEAEANALAQETWRDLPEEVRLDLQVDFDTGRFGAVSTDPAKFGFRVLREGNKRILLRDGQRLGQADNSAQGQVELQKVLEQNGGSDSDVDALHDTLERMDRDSSVISAPVKTYGAVSAEQASTPRDAKGDEEPVKLNKKQPTATEFSAPDPMDTAAKKRWDSGTEQNRYHWLKQVNSDASELTQFAFDELPVDIRAALASRLGRSAMVTEFGAVSAGLAGAGGYSAKFGVSNAEMERRAAEEWRLNDKSGRKALLVNASDDGAFEKEWLSKDFSELPEHVKKMIVRFGRKAGFSAKFSIKRTEKNNPVTGKDAEWELKPGPDGKLWWFVDGEQHAGPYETEAAGLKDFVQTRAGFSAGYQAELPTADGKETKHFATAQEAVQFLAEHGHLNDTARALRRLASTGKWSAASGARISKFSAEEEISTAWLGPYHKARERALKEVGADLALAQKEWNELPVQVRKAIVALPVGYDNAD